MKENNNSDNKLRQLENQSLPDLSKQDVHWQEMRKILQPDVAPAKPSASGKLWKWFLAACTVTAIILFTEKKLRKETTHKKEITTVQPTLQKEVLADTLKNIITADTTTKPASLQKTKTGLAIQKTSESKKQTYASLVSEKCNKCGTDWLNDTAVSRNDTPLPSKADEPKATLASFFAQLEKPSQEFVIDNTKDTVITGKDGTALLIPASTFNTKGTVTIVLKEFYSYEDIITNKLYTTSNGSQLVSGGMIHLTAISEGRKLNIKPSKSIKWFLPDTSAEMKDMQLFTGSENTRTNTEQELPHGDTVSITTNSSINWTPSSGRFSKDFITTKVKVLDIRDLPFKTNNTRKYKGYFFQNNDSELSKEELKRMLIQKYPYYEKVIIAGKRKKKEWKANWFISYGWQNDEIYYSVGDTTWLTPIEAKAYKLQVFDTVTYTNRTSTQKSSPSLNNQLKKVAAKYSVDINSLGWINCDKFYRDNRSKIEFVVNIGDSSSNYYTFLAFEKIKSMMPGYTSGSKVIFSNVPNGETAKIISIGIRNGKPVAAMKSVQLSNTTLTGLNFEETSPNEFREQVSIMDK